MGIFGSVVADLYKLYLMVENASMEQGSLIWMGSVEF